MLEIFCDSSFNQNGPSFIGCLILKCGREIHQSSTLVQPDPVRNLECELAAIQMAISMAGVFSTDGEHVIIYNDSTEAVREYQGSATGNIAVEYRPREDPYQSVADRLSKKFPQAKLETFDLCKHGVESFTPDILRDIASGNKCVVYLEKDERETTNTRTVYTLIIRDIDRVILGDRKYSAKSGEVKNIKVARDVSGDLEDASILASLAGRGADLNNSYFLLTDETWGLRTKGGEAYSILPCSIPHRIICHEVDRTAGNLFRRAAAYREKY